MNLNANIFEKNYKIKINRQTQVKEIKNLICDEFGICKENITIYLDGKYLQDSFTFQQLDVRKNTIHVSVYGNYSSFDFCKPKYANLDATVHSETVSNVVKPLNEARAENNKSN